MIDVLLLDDISIPGIGIKNFLQIANKKLKFECTVSHNDAFMILSQEPVRIVIIEPNFYGVNIEKGKEFITLIKQALPHQLIIVGSATPCIDIMEKEFFKSAGISIFIDKPWSFEKVYNLIMELIKDLPTLEKVGDFQSYISNLPVDYGKTSRIAKIISDEKNVIVSLIDGTTRMSQAYYLSHDVDFLKNSASELTKKIDESMGLFEEMGLIVSRRNLVPETTISSFERSYAASMLHISIPMNRLIDMEALNAEDVRSICWDMMPSYVGLGKAFEAIDEALHKTEGLS